MWTLLCSSAFFVWAAGFVSSETVTRKYYLDDMCDDYVDMGGSGLESIRLELTKHLYYSDNMECSVRVRAPTGKRLQIQVLTNSIANSVNCREDYLTVHDGSQSTAPYVSGFEGRMCWQTVLKKSYASTGEYVHFRFISNEKDPSEGFKILVTAFRDADDKCTGDEFQCRSSRRCVSKELVCDHYADCLDNSDECALTTSAIIGIAIACVLTFIIIVTIIACCCCFRGRWRNTGNSKQSVYETSDIYVTPTPEDLYSELQYHKAASLPRSLPPPPLPTIQVDSVPPYTEQVQTVHAYEPYHVKMIGPEMTHERHVWITAPPETTRVSRYSDE
ncbi:uncharacterized protein LOC128242462 [Mya arenaria]|uniref:uncharacterized protein LOC128242462 n=1 Tax=Mya arenaria TaxID=6604 RepID=UPI0022E362F8|nr:uncharacterized protein LOC128242462 [Mya arenaria]